MHMHPPLEMSVSRQLIALVVAIKNKKTKHHIRQKHETKTCPRQQNKLSPCFVWYAFYGLQSGNGVGPVLTTLELTKGVGLLEEYKTAYNIVLKSRPALFCHPEYEVSESSCVPSSDIFCDDNTVEDVQILPSKRNSQNTGKF